MITLAAGGFDARISLEGGSLTRLRWQSGDRTVPLLHEAVGEEASAACFPLVPFGNRVRDNVFAFAGQDYRLAPNTAGDRHYLHGDGWLDRWAVIRENPGRIELGLSRDNSPDNPYCYAASQTFAIEDGAFRLSLSVTNRGEEALPFGLGWHPFFPLTWETTLQVRAEAIRAEAEEWLPGARVPIPDDLDFADAKTLPRRWINNGFENVDGEARIVWPERGVALKLSADPLFRHAVLFVSDQGFDPDYRHEYFCFEPMSHLADGHHLPDLGGLRVLAPGETLAGSLLLRPERLS